MHNTSLRSQVIFFLLFTFAFSWGQIYFITKAPEGMENPVRVIALMWTPGLIALFLSWLFGSKFRDIGFKIGNWRYYLISYAIPVAAAFFILSMLLVFGLSSFEINPKLLQKAASMQNALFRLLVLVPTVGVFFSFFSALGEELGWRGFLHTKLVALQIPHPFLITGLIWAVWHWPLILYADYATSEHPILSLALFTIMVMSAGVLIGWIREKSGSVFTAALFHSVHNVWIQAIYPAFLKSGSLDPYFGGESGVFNALFYAALAIFIYKKYLIQGQLALTKRL